MNLISYEDFKKMDEYKKFIEENPDIGYLKIAAFTAYQAIPIENVEILITKDFNDYKVMFFRGYTNSSGNIENIELPAPKEMPADNFEMPKYTVYNLTAIHEGYETIKNYNVGMFGDIKSIQYVKMIPQIKLKGVEENGN